MTKPQSKAINGILSPAWPKCCSCSMTPQISSRPGIKGPMDSSLGLVKVRSHFLPLLSARLSQTWPTGTTKHVRAVPVWIAVGLWVHEQPHPTSEAQSILGTLPEHLWYPASMPSGIWPQHCWFTLWLVSLDLDHMHTKGCNAQEKQKKGQALCLFPCDQRVSFPFPPSDPSVNHPTVIRKSVKKTPVWCLWYLLGDVTNQACLLRVQVPHSYS